MFIGSDPSAGVKIDANQRVALRSVSSDGNVIALNTTANATNEVLIFGKLPGGDSVDVATPLSQLRAGVITLSAQGALIRYNSGEIEAVDDSGNVTTIS